MTKFVRMISEDAEKQLVGIVQVDTWIWATSPCCGSLLFPMVDRFKFKCNDQDAELVKGCGKQWIHGSDQSVCFNLSDESGASPKLEEFVAGWRSDLPVSKTSASVSWE